MIKFETITAADVKTDICNTILRELPGWFGIEESIMDYVKTVRQVPVYAAYDGERPIGFAAIKTHNEYSAEVCVMGVLEGYHMQGVGSQLIKLCEDYCLTNQKEFLTVKTLDSSAEYEPYEKTRNFYSKMGFIPLEVFPLHWDKNNPCLFLAKHIGKVEK